MQWRVPYTRMNQRNPPGVSHALWLLIFAKLKTNVVLFVPSHSSYDLYVWLSHIWGAYTNLNFDLEGLVLASSIKHIPGNNSCRVSVVCGTGKRSVIFWFKEIFLTLYQA